MHIPATILGLILCASAAVLLAFVSISPPVWDKIYFLSAGSSTAGFVHFGIFGFTGQNASLGYRLKPPTFNFNDGNLNTPVFLNLTRSLILHPIAGVIALLATLNGLLGVTFLPIGTAFMVPLSALASIVCLLAFLFDMVLFGIARNKFRSQGFSAQYGNACWITLGALVSLLLGFTLSACGAFGRYRKRTRTNFLS